MVKSPTQSPIGQFQKGILLAIAFLLTALLLFLRGGMNSSSPLEQMARRSLEPEIALSNGRPTLIEFYADWCEVCKLMAPEMEAFESEMKNKVDFVLLNVDNQSWADWINEFHVSGIPQMNFFDENGDELGVSIGLRSSEEMREIFDSLLGDKPFPELSGFKNTNFSRIQLNNEKKVDLKINPMSHG